LQHALTIANQIDYLGGEPTVIPKPVRTSNVAVDMLRFDLDNENETIKNYRVRVRQAEALVNTQSPKCSSNPGTRTGTSNDLATALGEDVRM